MKKTRWIFSLTLIITLMVLMVGCKKDDLAPVMVTFSVGETEVVVGDTDFEKEFTLTLAEPALVDAVFDITAVCPDDQNGNHSEACFELVDETVTIAKGEAVGIGRIKFLESTYRGEQINGDIYIYAKAKSTEFSVTPESIQLNIKGSNLYDGIYKMPIVYHLLYNDKNDSSQYPPVGFFESITKSVNDLTNGKYDTCIEYVLVGDDKNGNPLEEIGVNRVYIDPSLEIVTKEQFEAICMEEQYPLDECVNIFVYSFSKYPLYLLVSAKTFEK